MSAFTYPFLGENTCKYRDELIATAKAIGAPGKGIGAYDESMFYFVFNSLETLCTAQVCASPLWGSLWLCGLVITCNVYHCILSYYQCWLARAFIWVCFFTPILFFPSPRRSFVLATTHHPSYNSITMHNHCLGYDLHISPIAPYSSCTFTLSKHVYKNNQRNNKPFWQYHNPHRPE